VVWVRLVRVGVGEGGPFITSVTSPNRTKPYPTNKTPPPQHHHAVYEYTPIPPLAWPELSGEIWCHRYYLRNLCDEERFKGWAVVEHIPLLQVREGGRGTCSCICFCVYCLSPGVAKET